MLSVLINFRSLLASPTTDDADAMPANPAAARAFLTDPDEYELRNRCSLTAARAEGAPVARAA